MLEEKAYVVSEESIYIQDYLGLSYLNTKYNLFTHPEVLEILNIHTHFMSAKDDQNAMIGFIQSLGKDLGKLTNLIHNSAKHIALIQNTMIKSNLPAEFKGKKLYLTQGGKVYSL